MVVDVDDDGYRVLARKWRCLGGSWDYGGADGAEEGRGRGHGDGRQRRPVRARGRVRADPGISSVIMDASCLGCAVVELDRGEHECDERGEGR